MPNRLARATSPYLLQHADNPVDWREWGEEAFAEARRSDRPVLLSVGYAACHWCHVMAHESFEDPDIGRLINAHFVPVKVDREERPDVDTLYQQALALLGEQGGWPLTMFLTPDGEPFWGGTYFPPEPRYGRPGFRQVLERIAQLWREDRDRIAGSSRSLREALARLNSPLPGELDAAFVRRTAGAIGEEFDAVHGGIGGAPKFPQAPVLAFLWQVARRDRDPVLEHRVLHTLARMCQGGIYDHLGGGFARYAVDAFWLVPHFEKMLYDNAQLIALLAEAAAATGDPLYATRLDETVAWLAREMLTEGGFAASLDADSEGEEGRFYVWQAEEIDRLLGDDAAFFRLAYGVTGAGNWEGKVVLNRLHEPGLRPPQEEARLERCRRILFEARARRPHPARDDKVLADWNGLAVRGLVTAWQRQGEARYLELARDVFARVVERLADGDRLWHAWRAGRRSVPGLLDDHAQMIAAALALHEATGAPELLARARAWALAAERLFDEGDGRYGLSPRDARDLPVRPANAHDGPTPSAVGTLAAAFVRLHLLTGEAEWGTRAERLFSAHAGEARRNPFAHATLLSAWLTAAEPLQIVIAGTPGDPAREALLARARRTAPPDHVLLAPADATGLPPDHPAHGKSGRGGAAAFVCRGRTCLEPVADPDALAELLRGLPAAGLPPPPSSH